MGDHVEYINNTLEDELLHKMQQISISDCIELMDSDTTALLNAYLTSNNSHNAPSYVSHIIGLLKHFERYFNISLSVIQPTRITIGSEVLGTKYVYLPMSSILLDYSTKDIYRIDHFLQLVPFMLKVKQAKEILPQVKIRLCAEVSQTYNEWGYSIEEAQNFNTQYIVPLIGSQGDGYQACVNRIIINICTYYKSYCKYLGDGVWNFLYHASGFQLDKGYWYQDSNMFKLVRGDESRWVYLPHWSLLPRVLNGVAYEYA